MWSEIPNHSSKQVRTKKRSVRDDVGGFDLQRWGFGI